MSSGKDFYYYADQAESLVAQTQGKGAESQRIILQAAEVYARLAAAAPKSGREETR